jgi:ribosomal 50S subunit-recycling heat shock protein
MSRLIKRGAPLKANDRIVFAIGLRIIDVTITAIGTHRGSAEVAQTLYKRND